MASDQAGEAEGRGRGVDEGGRGEGRALGVGVGEEETERKPDHTLEAQEAQDRQNVPREDIDGPSLAKPSGTLETQGGASFVKSVEEGFAAPGSSGEAKPRFQNGYGRKKVRDTPGRSETVGR